MSNTADTTLDSSELVSGRRRFHSTVAKAEAADAVQPVAAPEEVAGWAATELPAEQVMLLVDDFNADVRPHTNRWKARDGAGLVLGWLDGLPGETWQERWLHAEDAFADRDWQQEAPDGRGDSQLAIAGMGSLIGLDIVRPSYRWLADNSFSSMWKRMGHRRDPDVYAKVTGWAEAAAGRRREAEEALLVLAKIQAHTGKGIGGLHGQDVLDYRSAMKAAGHRHRGLVLSGGGCVSSARSTTRHSSSLLHGALSSYR